MKLLKYLICVFFHHRRCRYDLEEGMSAIICYFCHRTHGWGLTRRFNHLPTVASGHYPPFSFRNVSMPKKKKITPNIPQEKAIEYVIRDVSDGLSSFGWQVVGVNDVGHTQYQHHYVGFDEGLDKKPVCNNDGYWWWFSRKWLRDNGHLAKKKEDAANKK